MGITTFDTHKTGYASVQADVVGILINQQVTEVAQLTLTKEIVVAFKLP